MYNMYNIFNSQCYIFRIVLLKYYSITPKNTGMFFFAHQSKGKIWICKKKYELISIRSEPKV